MRTFIDDDGGYLAWLSRNPQGNVLNLERSFNPNDLMLHRAECHTIRGVPARGEHWTVDPIKVCSMARTELMRWALAEVGGMLAECKFCEPWAIGPGAQARRLQSAVMSQDTPLSTQGRYEYG